MTDIVVPDDVKVGREVVAQANDNSWWNREPVLAKATAAGAATSICVALAAFGIITEAQRELIVEAVGEIVFFFFVILPIVVTTGTALWQRVSAWSGRSAARIAVLNAERPTGAPPVLPDAP